MVAEVRRTDLEKKRRKLINTIIILDMGRLPKPVTLDFEYFNLQHNHPEMDLMIQSKSEIESDERREYKIG